jgi:hypothetical protein
MVVAEGLAVPFQPLPSGVDIFCVRRFLAGLATAIALVPSACSVNQATSNVGTLDAPARQACSDLKAVIQARSTGLLDARELQGELAQVYASASTSVNPIIRARAVAVLADATQIASGGEGRSLDADLAALNQLCAGAGA